MSNYSDENTIRLNKLIALLGYCSRRKADELIIQGKVKVDNQVIKEPGFKANPSSRIEIEGNLLSTPDSVYILLNKPKNTITTTNDPQKRKTVIDLIQTNKRIFSVGRLDRNTTGTLLLTNDGFLCNKLTHPSGNIEKIYAATLDNKLLEKDKRRLLKGVLLNDGLSKFDKLHRNLNTTDFQYIITIHSGKNRIIRRMFNELNYNIIALHRISFAGLHTNNLARGKWRNLRPEEVEKLYKLF